MIINPNQPMSRSPTLIEVTVSKSENRLEIQDARLEIEPLIFHLHTVCSQISVTIFTHARTNIYMTPKVK